MTRQEYLAREATIPMDASGISYSVRGNTMHLDQQTSILFECSALTQDELRQDARMLGASLGFPIEICNSDGFRLEMVGR